MKKKEEKKSNVNYYYMLLCVKITKLFFLQVMTCLLSHLLMLLGSLYCKQYEPRSDCSLDKG